MKYNVKLTASALVSASVEVEADTEEEANSKAIPYAKEGNALWNYDGIESNSSIEIGE